MIEWKQKEQSCESAWRLLLSALFKPSYLNSAGASCGPRMTRKNREERREKIMLYHKCKCGKLIPQEMRRCPECEKKENESESRHVEYNRHRRNKKAAAFYTSGEWRKVRALTLSTYDGLDMYAYYVQHTIEPAEMVHHIVEIEDDWSRRLDITNLFPLSDRNHGIISALYRRDPATKRHTQEQLREILRKHWEGAGGPEKVLGGPV